MTQRHRWHAPKLPDGPLEAIVAALRVGLSRLDQVLSVFFGGRYDGDLEVGGFLTAQRLTLRDDDPIITLLESDAAVNEKWWQIIASGGDLKLNVVTDAGVIAQTLLLLQRSGAAIYGVDITAPVRADITSGFTVGDVPGQRRIKWNAGASSFGFLTDADNYAHLEANNATLAGDVECVNVHATVDILADGNVDGQVITAANSLVSPVGAIDAVTAVTVAADQVSADELLGGVVRPGHRLETLGGGATVTPNADTEQSVSIWQTVGATVVNIAAPTGSPTHGQRLTVALANTSGGAVTWSFAAGYHLDTVLGAPAPASGSVTTLTFERLDLGSAIRWYEVARVTTTI